VVHLLKRDDVSQMLAMEEIDSGHRTIPPYVHGRFCVVVYGVVQALSSTFVELR
jgi:hypothetical protein